jgi:hypothetical protein
LHGVAAPSEVGGVPAEEVLCPIREEVYVLGIACAPASRDGIASEVNVDAPPFLFLDQLLMRNA